MWWTTFETQSLACPFQLPHTYIECSSTDLDSDCFFYLRNWITVRQHHGECPYKVEGHLKEHVMGTPFALV